MTRELITRRAPLRAKTWNAETRTFEAVLSTGAPVARWDARGEYDELLAIEGARSGVTLFHADHGNVAATPAAITVDSLSAARLAMRKQKGLQGELIAATPKFILVGAERETEAEKVVAAITAAESGNVNPFSGKLEIVVDARLGSAWFVVADPTDIDGLEYAYLEGSPGPQIDSQVGFDVDGVRFRVRLDFGGGFVDWRGWHRNAGAP